MSTNQIDSVRAIRVPGILAINVAEFHFEDLNGISHWDYPEELQRNTIALQFDETDEIALVPDTKDVQDIIANRELNTVDVELEGMFGDGNSGTVEILPSSDGFIIVEVTQRFSQEFCENYGI